MLCLLQTTIILNNFSITFKISKSILIHFLNPKTAKKIKIKFNEKFKKTFDD